MPNLCFNQITVTGPELILDALLARAAQPPVACPSTAGSAPSAFSLERLDPTPPALLKAGGVHGGWYEWRLAHWGTKWDLAEVRVERKDECVTIAAVSAWEPPLAALRALSRHYPKLCVRVSFEEPGAGFIGAATFRAGKCVNEAEREMTKREMTKREMTKREMKNWRP